MSRQLSAEQDRLRALAEGQYALISDRDVFACWHVVVEAISREWLGPDTLTELIEALENGGGRGAEEYSIEVAYELGEPPRVTVAFVDQVYSCGRDEMVRELRRLWTRFYHNQEKTPPNPGGGGVPRRPPPDDDVTAAADLLRSIADLGDKSVDDAVVSEIRAQLAVLLAEWEAGGRDVGAANTFPVDALGPDDRDRLARGLRDLTAWMRKPEAVPGAPVDELIAALDRSLGPVLERGRQADEAATRERIADAARGSISQRLREQGLS